MKRYYSLFLVFLVSLTLFGESKRVLIIHSYHQGFHWTDREHEGITSLLGERGDIELHIEYMDTKRREEKEYIEFFHDFMAYKYADKGFDVIITTDDSALNFVVRYGEALFPSTPRVFCGVNFFDFSRLRGQNDFYGIHEDYNLPEALNLMMRLHPETKEIALIFDKTLSGQILYQIYENCRDSITVDSRITLLVDLTTKELVSRLKEMDEDSLVFWAMYQRSRDGINYTPAESIALVKSATDSPVYAMWDVMDYGAVGGLVASPYYQGLVAGQMTLKLLRGERDGLPHISQGPLSYIFDARELKAYDISIRSLPPGSEIRYRPHSHIRESPWLFSGIFAAFLVMLTVIILLFWHIRQRRKTEKLLSISREQLAQKRKMDAVGQLAGGVAHDFNNLLTGIMGAAELLQASDLTEEETRTYLNMIIESSEQAADLTTQLLAFGRKGNQKKQRLDLHQAVNDTLKILEKTINRNITFRLDFPQTNPAIMGNKAHIQNVIMNLCINASQAMDKGGEILISTSAKGTDKVTLSVEDKGCGIPPGKLEKIFEPFYTTKDSGTGLGLSAVYGTVRDHDGEIDVTSKVGEGTRFDLTFPLCSKDQ